MQRNVLEYLENSVKKYPNKIKFIIDVFKTYSNRIIEVEDNSPVFEEII